MNTLGVKRFARGSVFMETMVAVVLVGVAVAALMEFMAGSTAAHGTVQQMMRGAELANSALEYMATQPFDACAELEGKPRTFSPPVDAQGVALPACQGWSQEVVARNVNDNALLQTAPDRSTPALWITVTTRQNGRVVFSQGRLQTRAL